MLNLITLSNLILEISTAALIYCSILFICCYIKDIGKKNCEWKCICHRFYRQSLG